MARSRGPRPLRPNYNVDTRWLGSLSILYSSSRLYSINISLLTAQQEESILPYNVLPVGMKAALLLAFSSPRALAFHSSFLLPRPAAARRHLFATKSNDDDKLCTLAKDFIRHKNSAGRGDTSLDAVFDMCSPAVDLYGLSGDNVRPGFVSFFEQHQGLYHELLAEPEVIGPMTVQYPFIKKWKNQDGQEQVWKSIDPDKPRNKVERLAFDEQGMLEKVCVVEADSPLE